MLNQEEKGPLFMGRESLGRLKKKKPPQKKGHVPQFKTFGGGNVKKLEKSGFLRYIKNVAWKKNLYFEEEISERFIFKRGTKKKSKGGEVCFIAFGLFFGGTGFKGLIFKKISWGILPKPIPGEIFDALEVWGKVKNL